MARATGDALHPYVVITTYYVVGWGVGAIYFTAVPNRDPRFAYSREDILVALIIGSVSWICFTAGYMWLPRRPAPSFPEDLDDVQALRPTLIILYAAGWIARLLLLGSGRYWHVSASQAIGASSTSFATASFAALPTLALVVWGVGRPSEFRRARLVGFLVEVAWYLPTGGRAQVVGVLLAYVATDYYGRGHLPRARTMALAGVVFIVIFPAVLSYRGQGTNYEGSVTSSATSALTTTIHAPPSRLVSNAANSTFSRFVDPLSTAVVLHDGRIPIERYRPGSTYAMTVTSLLPRIVVPSKPDPGVFGNAFGRTYHFTNEADLRTSVTIGQPLEAYWNYGPLGVLLVLPIVGILYARLVPALLRLASPTRAKALYAANLLIFATSPGTILADGFATFVKTVLLQALALWAVALTVPSRQIAATRVTRPIHA
jgi:hypothetical protein